MTYEELSAILHQDFSSHLYYLDGRTRPLIFIYPDIGVIHLAPDYDHPSCLALQFISKVTTEVAWDNGSIFTFSPPAYPLLLEILKGGIPSLDHPST